MKITVIGCGRWGSFIAWYLDRIGHDVTLYGRESSVKMRELMAKRGNDFLTLPPGVKLSTLLESALGADIVVISISSQALARLTCDLHALGMKNKIVVLAMKGIETETGKRLSEIAALNLDASNRIAVWLGPGHVQEFYRGLPNCMVIDSAFDDVRDTVVNAFSNELIRFYYGRDLIGNEIGAASKNVIGIAAGMLDGMDLGSLKGALMSRGTREIARLITAMGGNELSAYGLCHLGDYEATVFSPYSHNRQFGECFVSNKSYVALAEGYYTTRAMIVLGEKYRVELPICSAVYDILYNGKEVLPTLNKLFTRSIKKEF